jgi:ubiquinol-cytochrome c reductase cytochrome c subunit
MRLRLKKTTRARKLIAGPAALFALALIVGSVLFMTGTSAHGSDSLVSTNPADIQAGSVLYQAHCQSCHGFQGEGGQTSAPALVSVGAAAADFYLSTGRMPLNDPSQQPLRHRPFFNSTQIRQLVAYISALPVITGNPSAGPTIPTLLPLCSSNTTATTDASGSSPDCVTLAQGQQAWAVDCAHCHQAAGAGGMLSKGYIVPSLRPSSITQVLEAVRVGPRPMPTFSTATLSDSQASAIAQYVTYLHHRGSNPGGFSIAHFGPIPEGFAGILAGFVVLWFASRMIGNRG